MGEYKIGLGVFRSAGHGLLNASQSHSSTPVSFWFYFGDFLSHPIHLKLTFKVQTNNCVYLDFFGGDRNFTDMKTF